MPNWRSSCGHTGSIWRSICASITSTRDVLQHTGARFLAGFDYLGQFPFLDIALDWDGDRTLQRKRSHIVDDLMRAGECDRPRHRNRSRASCSPVRRRCR